jgi:TPP-dependent 2-oxoacid decarboxylase
VVIMKKQDWLQQQEPVWEERLDWQQQEPVWEERLDWQQQEPVQQILLMMKQGGVVLAMGKKTMSRAVIQLSLGVDVVGNLLWLAVGVAMGLSVGVDVVCD